MQETTKQESSSQNRFWLLAATIIGAAGFLAGYLAPILHTPGANQGPLFGIFFSGPLGFALGAGLGFLLQRCCRSRRQAMIVTILAAITFAACMWALVYFDSRAA